MQHFRFEREIFDRLENDFDCVFFRQSWNLKYFFWFVISILRLNNLTSEFRRRVDEKSERLTKFKFFFSCNYFLLFVRRFEILLSRLFCAHHRSNSLFASRCRHDVDALLILMRFRFRHEFRSRHNCIDCFVNVRLNEICKDFHLFNDI